MWVASNDREETPGEDEKLMEFERIHSLPSIVTSTTTYLRTYVLMYVGVDVWHCPSEGFFEQKETHLQQHAGAAGAGATQIVVVAFSTWPFLAVREISVGPPPSSSIDLVHWNHVLLVEEA